MSIQNDYFTRVIPTRRDDARQLIRDAVRYLRQKQQSGMACCVSEFDFRLVLDEALENSLVHGNACDPDKCIHISIMPFLDGVELSIRDEGEGFAPDAVPNPRLRENFFRLNGRGLHLLKNLGEVSWNDKGNVLTIKLNSHNGKSR